MMVVTENEIEIKETLSNKNVQIPIEIQVCFILYYLPVLKVYPFSSSQIDESWSCRSLDKCRQEKRERMWWESSEEGSREETMDVVGIYIFVYLVEAHMRASTQYTTRGAWDMRGRSGNDNTVRNRDIRRSVEWRGMGWGTRGIQDGHYREFQEGRQRIWSRWVWGGLTGVKKIEVLDGGR